MMGRAHDRNPVLLVHGDLSLLDLLTDLQAGLKVGPMARSDMPAENAAGVDRPRALFVEGQTRALEVSRMSQKAMLVPLSRIRRRTADIPGDMGAEEALLRSLAIVEGQVAVTGCFRSSACIEEKRRVWVEKVPVLRVESSFFDLQGALQLLNRNPIRCWIGKRSLA
jgi:hypothetical protein